MVALAIIASVSFYIIPSYQNSIRRGHRLVACTAVYRAAQMIERSSETVTRIASGKVGSLPAGFEQAPQDAKAVYRLRAHANNGTNGGYTIEAEPINPGPMHGDRCGRYLLDANGRRANQALGEAAQASPKMVAYCWQGR
ncbi:prepilin-type N-terminal cleavage/methylation domain-containing protein [Mycoavidus sp. B2-EB]|nr:prepilin-type N-terminal cleavage/methylation domain-containing protein [Mycoavidus sp. B2-EB]